MYPGKRSHPAHPALGWEGLAGFGPAAGPGGPLEPLGELSSSAALQMLGVRMSPWLVTPTMAVGMSPVTPPGLHPGGPGWG